MKRVIIFWYFLLINSLIFIFKKNIKCEVTIGVWQLECDSLSYKDGNSLKKTQNLDDIINGRL